MATITTGYSFANGELNITHTKLNNAVNLATITGIVAGEISSGAITAVKLNANCAGLGLAQNGGDSSLQIVGYGVAAVTLTSGTTTLTRSTSDYIQKFSGTLSGACIINLSRTNAVEGDRFYFRMNGPVTTASNTLTIQENGSGSLIVFNESKTLKGGMTFQFNGTSWELHENNVIES